MEEPRSLTFGTEHPTDPFATAAHQEPRSLYLPKERPQEAQNVGVGVVDIPSRLIGGAGIRVTTEGTAFAVDMDIAELTVAEPGDPSQQWVPVWVDDQPAVEIRRVPVSAIPVDAPADSVIYGRQNHAWVPVEGAGGGSTTPGGVTISDTPPADPVDGQLWLESDSGALFARWNDPNSSQWVQVNGGGSGGGGGLDQATADARYVNVTGDTMSGSLIVNAAVNATGAGNFGSVNFGSGIQGTGNYTASGIGVSVTLDNTSPGTNSAGFNWQRSGINNWIIQHAGTTNDLNFLRRNTTTGAGLDTPLALKADGSVAVGSGGIVNNGNLTIQKGAPYINIDNTDGGAQSSGIQWQRSGVTNWLMMEGATGANNDWILQRYNAGGTYQDAPIRIAFATGAISLATPTTSSVAGTAAVALMGLSANGHGVYGNTTNSAYCGVIGYNFDNSAIARLGYNTYAAYLTGPAAITAGTLNITNTASTDHIRLVNGANSQSFGYAGGMGNYNVSPSTMRHTLHYAGTAGYNFDQSFFFCTPSGGMTLGTGTYRWGQIYSTVGTISTSDERIKQDIRPLDEAEKRVAQALKGLIVAYRYKEAVTAKGDEARIHVGVIAQRVAEAFAAEGLDAARYGLWCADEQYTEEYVEDVPTPVEEIDEETGEARTVTKMAGRYEKTMTGEVLYSIRYEELLAFIIGGL